MAANSGSKFDFAIIQAKIKAEITRRLQVIGDMYVREIKLILGQSGNYRMYRRGKRIHYSAIPGTYPAIDYGRLRASVSYNYTNSGMIRAIIKKPAKNSQTDDSMGQPTSSDPDTQILVVGTNVKYGRYLEFGTSRMGARPWLIPKFEQLKFAARMILEAPMDKMLK